MKTWMAGTRPGMTKRGTSIDSRAAVLDGLAPLHDLVLHELTEIRRRHAVLAHDVDAERLELLTYLRGFHRFNGRRVKLLHDRVRRAVRQEDCVPRICGHIDAALL